MQKDKENKTLNKDKPIPGLALALGSGVARGFAHIGVLRVLKKNGIIPSIVTGTSMGAVVGACFLATRLNDLEDWALSLTRRKLFSYMDIKVRAPGLIGGKHLKLLLEDNFGDLKVEDLPSPFIAIATDMGTGHEVWLRKGLLVDALQASFALPGVFPPVERNNRFLIDGALVNPVPIAPCHALNARMTIGVDLNADFIGKAQRKGSSYQSVMGFDMFGQDGASEVDQKTLSKNSFSRRIFRRNDAGTPSLFGVMVSSLTIIQDRLTRSRLAGDPPDIHIKAPVGHIGLLEFERAKELIELGEEATERMIPEIKAGIEALVINHDA